MICIAGSTDSIQRKDKEIRNVILDRTEQGWHGLVTNRG